MLSNYGTDRGVLERLTRIVTENNIDVVVQ